MAWICVDLDDTLVVADPMSGESCLPTDGAVEAMQTLASEGHRLTVYTSRFAPMPASEKQRVKEEIEELLQTLGFPPMEVWTGTTKPKADVFVDNKGVTYDGDWGLVLAQTQQMLEDQGVLPGPQPGEADRQLVDGGGEEEQEEEAQ
jgi:hypothetical protein